MRVSHVSSRIGSRHPAGFSLIEIVIVLTLIALLAAGGLAIMTVSSSEHGLRGASGDVEAMAKRARTIALLQQKPYALIFVPGKISLMPYAEAIASAPDTTSSHAPSRNSRSNSSSNSDSDAPPPDTHLDPVHQETVFDDTIEILVKRWASDKWVTLDEHHPQVWRFDPDGLCEPISVHIGLNGSWIEDEYHPLTAGIRDTASEMR